MILGQCLCPSVRLGAAGVINRRYRDIESTSFQASAQPNLSAFRNTFLGLHIAGGYIGLPLLIITLLVSDEVPHEPNLVNFCIIWIIYSISYTLLLLSGRTTNPPHVLCFIQAAMLQGATPMAAVATFLLVFKVWRTFRDPYNRYSAPALLYITLSLPYLVFLGLFLTSVTIQLKLPATLNANNQIYCTTSGTRFRRFAIPTISLILAVLMLGFESAIAVRYYRSRKRIAASFPLAHQTMSLSLIIRLWIFNIYLFVTMGSSITFLFGKMRPWAYLIQAALPLTAFTLFASQKNVVLAWLFCLRKRIKPCQPDAKALSLQPLGRRSEGRDYTPIQGRDISSSRNT